MQQIRRMDLEINDAIKKAENSTNPHHLSGRCSVFCKSDCTHALNKGESIADVTAGLSKLIAGKIKELLVKVNAQNVLMIGGTARNSLVVDYLKENFPSLEVPESCYYFEALGAALWAYNTQKTHQLANFYKPFKPSFDTLKPINSIDTWLLSKNLSYVTTTS